MNGAHFLLYRENVQFKSTFSLYKVLLPLTYMLASSRQQVLAVHFLAIGWHHVLHTRPLMPKNKKVNLACCIFSGLHFFFTALLLLRGPRCVLNGPWKKTPDATRNAHPVTQSAKESNSTFPSMCELLAGAPPTPLALPDTSSVPQPDSPFKWLGRCATNAELGVTCSRLRVS